MPRVCHWLTAADEHPASAAIARMVDSLCSALRYSRSCDRSFWASFGDKSNLCIVILLILVNIYALNVNLG